MFHTFRRWKLLTFSKKAPVLGWLLVIKALLLLLDVATQGLFLYCVLVRFSSNIFKSNGAAIPVMLSIIISSPFITLATNSLINIPLHYWFLKLKLRSNQVKETISFKRILKSAFYQSFHHWMVVLCGLGGLYVFAATFWLLQVVKNPSILIDITSVSGVSNVYSFLQIGSNSYLAILVQINVICNYGVGVLTAICFWVLTLLSIVYHIVI